MIRALLSLHGGTLEITLTVPLIYVLPNVICASFTPIKVFFSSEIPYLSIFG